VPGGEARGLLAQARAALTILEAELRTGLPGLDPIRATLTGPGARQRRRSRLWSGAVARPYGQAAWVSVTE
jgi:hypothetical protein